MPKFAEVETRWNGMVRSTARTARLHAWPGLGLASVEDLFRVFYRDLTCPAGSVAFDDLRIVVAVSVVTHARS